MNFFGANFGAEYVDLSQVQFTPELLSRIPGKIARKYRVMPVHQTDKLISVALVHPWDLNTIDTLVHLLHQEVDIRAADKAQLDAFIERFYSADNSAA